MKKGRLIIIILILIIGISGYFSYQYLKNYREKQRELQELQQTKDFIDKVDELYNKFNIIKERAGVTMRVSVSPVVGEMQNVLLELNEIKVPENCIECYTNLKKYFETTIDSFIEFMAMYDSASYSLSQQALIYENQFNKCRDELSTKH